MKRGSFFVFLLFFLSTIVSLLGLFSVIKTEGIGGVYILSLCLSCFGAGYNVRP